MDFTKALLQQMWYKQSFVCLDVENPLADLALRFRRVLRGNTWQRAIDGRSVCLDFGLVENVEIGAFAFAEQDAYFVVFHHGLFSALLDVFCRVVDLLPLTAEFDKTPLPSSPLTLSLEVGRSLGLPSVYPRTAERLSLAVKLQVIALEYLFLHEWHHILTGHLGEVVSRGNQPSIEEFGQPASDIDHEAQAMEFTADLFAARTLIDSWANGRAMLLRNSQFATTTTGRETSLYMVQLAVTTLFCLMQETSQAAYPNGHPGYPDVLIRYVVVEEHITDWLDQNDQELSGRWSLIAGKAIMELKKLLPQIGHGKHLVHEINDDPILERAFERKVSLAENAVALQEKWLTHSIRTVD
jgi:hypothetical protein